MKNQYILICSDELEGTTDLVCDWLLHLDKPFIRISSSDLIEINSIIFEENGICDIVFTVKNLRLNLSQIKSYWYRRSKLRFTSVHTVEYIKDGLNMSEYIYDSLKREYEIIVDFFEMKLDEKAFLNKEIDNKINKLYALSLASKLGIKIPKTTIANNKKTINVFSKDQLITKAIGDIMFTDDKFSYGMMTNKIDPKNIESELFFHTLFQKEVKKQFELRIFYFDGKFYSSAIFSQGNENTELDFRNYDNEKPNRVIPFKLPESIECKLIELTKKLDIHSGSIDLAFDDKGDFVFFELNPVGQFEQVSFPCNYNLHKKIAELL